MSGMAFWDSTNVDTIKPRFEFDGATVYITSEEVTSGRYKSIHSAALAT